MFLSTQYRLKLEAICNKIVKAETVELSEIIWAEKLAKSNAVASKMLRQSRRKAANPDMVEGSMDDFLNQLDLGPVGPDDRGIQRFNSPDEIADFFRRDDLDEEEGDNTWRRRD